MVAALTIPLAIRAFAVWPLRFEALADATGFLFGALAIMAGVGFAVRLWRRLKGSRAHGV